MTTEERARQDALYAGEPWAALAIEAGFRPYDTESAAREAFRFCAEKFARPTELHERIVRLFADAEQLAVDLRAARDRAPAGEKHTYRYPLRDIERAAALIRKAGI